MNKLHVVWITVMSIGLAEAAWAQQRSSGNGRALDSNHLVGSGGRNSVEGYVDYRQRGDVITGNVPSGRSFHQDVGYRAPGDFRGVLGSDSLFDFRINSYASRPDQLNAATPPPDVGGPPIVIPRSFHGLGAAQLTAGPSARLEVGAEGGVFRVTDLQSLVTSTVLKGDRLDRLRTPGQISIQDPSKGPGMALAAPTLPSPVSRVARQRPPSKLLQSFEPDRTSLAAERLLDDQDDLNIKENIALSSRLDGAMRPILTQDGQAEETMGSIPEGPTAIGPSILIGRQLQALISSDRVDLLETRTFERLQRIESSLLRTVEMYSDRSGSLAYEDIVQAIRQSDQTGPQDSEELSLAYHPTQSFLRIPTEKELDQARQDLEDSINRTGRVRNRFEDDEEEGSEDVDRPNQAAHKKLLISDSLETLLDRLNYDLPPVPTLAGQREDTIDQHLRQAEIEFAKGHFLTAESIYRIVLVKSPSHPMARVGLVHSQFGGGMIRSAALNLRRLFEQHPELIAARYAENLLPNEPRLKWIQGELEKSIRLGDTAKDAGLMLAYLGHQIGSRQLVKYGLLIAESREPMNPLLPVLQHIWLDSKQHAASKPSDNQ